MSMLDPFASDASNPLNLDPVWQLPHFMLRDGTLDGGDTGHNAYTILYCAPNELYAEHCDSLLFSADGWPRRSPDESRWYGKPGRCSRDLLTPVLCCAVRHDAKLFWHLIGVMSTKCFLFANNPVPNYEFNAHKRKMSDVLGPDIWAVCLRGLLQHGSSGWQLLRPLLWACDVHGLLRAVLHLLKPGSQDQRNSALKHDLGNRVHPTLISKLAYRIYLTTRPRDAFRRWWSYPGEPRIDAYMCDLYSK